MNVDRQKETQKRRPEQKAGSVRKTLPGAPTIVDSEIGPIVFGPGLDDINEYDDPC